MILAILRASRTALRRRRSSLTSIAHNIFFPATAYFLRQAGAFIWLIAGVVLLFPLSSDPMREIPPERLAMWPLNTHQRRILRLLTPWLNPVTWLLAAVTIWGVGRSISFGLWGLLIAMVAIGFLAPSLPVPGTSMIYRAVPRFPGAFGHLLCKDLRQLVTTLEFWMTLVLGVAANVYRFVAKEFPPEAGLMISLLIILAFASLTACLFGMDRDPAMTRYALLPVPGWLILLSKDVAVLAVVLVLTAMLAPLAALAATLITLAVGHSRSVSERSFSAPWRFSPGASIGFGVMQLLAIAFAGAASRSSPVIALGVATAAYAVSTWWYGRKLLSV